MAVRLSSPMVLVKRKSKSTKTDNMRSKEVGGGKVEEKLTKGQQKLGEGPEGENWELRLLAGSFSVLPRISRGTKVKGGVRRGGHKRGERAGQGQEGHHTCDRACASHRGDD